MIAPSKPVCGSAPKHAETQTGHRKLIENGLIEVIQKHIQPQRDEFSQYEAIRFH